MARYVLLSVALLAFCAVALAQRWPSGVPGGEELSAIAAAKDSSATVLGKDHKKVYKKPKKTTHYHPSEKKSDKYDKDDKYDDSYIKGDKTTKKPNAKPEDSPYWKSYEPKDDPFDAYGNAGPGTGKDAYNTAPEHVWEHLGSCIGSNHVSASGPLNSACPPGPPAQVLGQTAVSPCKVPEYCQNLPNGAEPCTCPEGEFARFDAGHMADHFTEQPGPFPMVDVRHSTYECVDARGSGPMLGTPGGDLAEVMKVAMAIMKLAGRSWSKDIADQVFDIFADEVASQDRPLYFHTDDIRLRSMFKALTGKLSGKPADYMPSILPFEAPENDADAELWMSNLVKAEYQGCGHIRLMIEEPTRPEYSVLLTGDAVAKCESTTPAASCVDAKTVAQYLIGKFFRYWWFSPSGSPERRQVAFQVDGILQGPLLGKGVAIISNDPADACTDHAPAVRSTFGGSQVFVYHGTAVGLWREYVANTYLGGIARKYDLAVDDILATWNAIAGQQLGATLANLVPANRVGLFSVTVPTVPVVDEEYSSGYGQGGKY